MCKLKLSDKAKMRWQYVIIILLLFAASFAHGQENVRVEKVCYTYPEMEKIAAAMTELKELRVVHYVDGQEMAKKDTALANATKQAADLFTAITDKQKIITLTNEEKTAADKELKKKRRINKAIKIGWAATAIALTGLLVIMSLK